MKLLRIVTRKIFGLFVDDEFLALATIVVIGATAIILKVAAMGTIVNAMILLGGCLAVLVASVWRTARAQSRS